MRITYSPRRSDRKLAYSVSGEAISATLDGITDVFDFSGIPDGVLDVSSLDTILDVCPIVSARRVDGQLEVKLLKFHGPDAPESERFPEPEVFG